MKTDAELLRRYLAEHSEPAFTELVQRHLGLVYSVALRRVGGDAHLAEDVAQRVFSDLARKASSLTGHATLAGWLYTAAHVASAATVRTEQRRKLREIEANTMETITAPESVADWTRLRPVIDDAFVGLKADEREAIALRFFEKRSFAEVGAALRITEEAARKRVDRTLEKLRTALERRGVTSTASALAVALAAIATTSAPVELSAKIAGHAFASASAATSSGGVVGSVLSASWPAAAVLVLGGMLVATQRTTNHQLQSELAQLSQQRAGLATLRTENQQLSRELAQVEALRSALTASPAPQPSPVLAAATTAVLVSRPIAASIAVMPSGTLAFNRDATSLREFVQRLREVSRTADPDSRVHVHAPGTPLGAVAYVIEEARKAGVTHLTVESDAAPDPKFNWWWF